MQPAKWQRLASEVVHETAWYRLSRDRYVLPGGAEGVYTYVDIPGSTMVVPAFEDGTLLLVRQFRYLMQRPSLEFPAGGLKRGVDPLDNARRELHEEAGLLATSWTELGRFAPYNGVSNEYCRVYLATGLEPVPAAPEPTEEMECQRMSLDELRAIIDRGELWDGMTVASLALYESWLRRTGSVLR